MTASSSTGMEQARFSPTLANGMEGSCRGSWFKLAIKLVLVQVESLFTEVRFFRVQFRRDS